MIVGPGGIEQRLPWGKRDHPFRDIQSLLYVPEGMSVESERRNSPWYEVRFNNGQVISFGNENERLADEELQAIVRYIDDRTWQSWRIRPDVQQRRPQ